jgi:hypothetical protein
MSPQASRSTTARRMRLFTACDTAVAEWLATNHGSAFR